MRSKREVMRKYMMEIRKDRAIKAGGDWSIQEEGAPLPQLFACYELT